MTDTHVYWGKILKYARTLSGYEVAELQQLAGPLDLTITADYLDPGPDLEELTAASFEQVEQFLSAAAPIIQTSDGVLDFEYRQPGQLPFYYYYWMSAGQLFRQRGDLVRGEKNVITVPPEVAASDLLEYAGELRSADGVIVFGPIAATRDSQRAHVWRLIQLAPAVVSAEGEIVCLIDLPTGEIAVEFYTIADGNLYLQKGAVARHYPEVVTGHLAISK
jgi:hypothetical protein